MNEPVYMPLVKARVPDDEVWEFLGVCEECLAVVIRVTKINPGTVKSDVEAIAASQKAVSQRTVCLHDPDCSSLFWRNIV